MSPPVFDKTGKKAGDIDLPAVFAGEVRPDLVRKAVKVAQANKRQRYGANPVAGERHATRSIGKGKGASRVPRLTQGGAAALAPNVVGGRRAHPPSARKDWAMKINKKERRLAIASALAATAQSDLVAARGHKTDGIAAFPLVVEDDAFAGKAKDAQAALAALGLDADLSRAKLGRNERPGMGKLRGRRVKQPKSVLFVTVDGKAPAVRNLSGVDVVAAKDVSAEMLAPGGDVGRLTVFTKSALTTIQEAYQ